jgi:hypothetical protein
MTKASKLDLEDLLEIAGAKGWACLRAEKPEEAVSSPSGEPIEGERGRDRASGRSSSEDARAAEDGPRRADAEAERPSQ